MVGIVSYGAYIPHFRITVADIARAWGKAPAEVEAGLGITEKSVPASDEDAVTIAIEASSRALTRAHVAPSSLGALLVGSESHPYAVNPTSTIVGELLGVGHEYLAADLEFACKAGSAGMQAIAGLLSAGQIAYGMAIGADTAQSRPHDVLEYTSSAAGAAMLLGTKKVIANLRAYSSYSSDTPDFWRRDGIRYPSHAGRFTGEPAYFAHVLGASSLLLRKAHVAPKDIAHCVFHMPNGKFPKTAAKRLGFSSAQLSSSLVVDAIGNPYSASSLVGLAAVLDIAKPNELIFMVSYGSGAGSDAFLIEATAELPAYQVSAGNDAVAKQIATKTYITYVEYLKQTHKI